MGLNVPRGKALMGPSRVFLAGSGATLFLVIVLGGCAETVTLRNEKTAREITCGGELLLPGRPTHTDKCVTRHESLGYKRVQTAR
jgi:hypothetical protein